MKRKFENFEKSSAPDCVSSIKVISGGQTGADQAALRAAVRAKIQTGGWAPKNFLTSDGNNYELNRIYNLQEIDEGGSVVRQYIRRSQKNVDDADVTIAFRTKPSVGTDKTIGYAKTHQWKIVSPKVVSKYKPCLIVENLTETEKVANEICDFIFKNKARVVNFCGHRNDSSSGKNNFSVLVEQLLDKVFQKLQNRF